MQIVIVATDILVRAIAYIVVLELFRTNDEKNSPYRLRLSNVTREEDNFTELQALELFGLVNKLIDSTHKS